MVDGTNTAPGGTADIDWETLAELYAFLGNSLLSPMSQTADVGLDAAFWEALPQADDPGVASGLAKIAAYAERVSDDGRSDAVQECSVEFTKLFIGPPRPAAPPWETMYRNGGSTVGFGTPTFAMRKRLREAGLEQSNENHQYEDHLGIELLYLSVLCQRVDGADGSRAGDNAAGTAVGPADVASFMDDHLLPWIPGFLGDIAEAFPEGYFVGLVEYTLGMLSWHRARLG